MSTRDFLPCGCPDHPGHVDGCPLGEAERIAVDAIAKASPDDGPRLLVALVALSNAGLLDEIPADPEADEHDTLWGVLDVLFAANLIGRFPRTIQTVRAVLTPDAPQLPAPAPEVVSYLVAEKRDGDWLFGDDWVQRHVSLDAARKHIEDSVATHAKVSTMPYPYRVGVLAVTVVDEPAAVTS